MTDTIDKITRRPENVQIFELYKDLSQSKRISCLEGIDASNGLFDTQDVDRAIIRQGIAELDIPETKELIEKWGYLSPVYGDPWECVVDCYEVTHKGLAFYHGMLADTDAGTK